MIASVRSLPYLLPEHSRSDVIAWWRMPEDSARATLPDPLGDEIAHWDPTVTLRIAADLRIDTVGIRKDCCLAKDSILSAVLIWESAGTRLRGCGERRDMMADSGIEAMQLSMVLPGHLLSGQVLLIAQIALQSGGSRSHKLSPQRPGSILWRDTHTVTLEGAGSRFPVELVDFGDGIRLPPDAGWFLMWDAAGLDQLAMQSLRLLVNSKHKRVKEAVTLADEGASAQAILEAMRFDVARQMISAALRNDEFVERPDVYAAGTVGCYIRRLLRLYFPTDSFAVLRRQLEERPSSFESELQGRFKLYGGESASLSASRHS